MVKKLSEGTVDKFYVAQSSSLTPAVPKKRGGKGKASDAPNPTDANDNVEAGALKKRGRKLKALATDEADGNASGIENGNAKKRPRTKKLAAESAYDHGSRLHDAKVYTTERKSESPATKRIKTSPDADVKVKDEDDTAANGLNTTVEGDESSGTAEDTVES